MPLAAFGSKILLAYLGTVSPDATSLGTFFDDSYTLFPMEKES